ncbi:MULTISPECIES: MDR family MFS transporter [Rhodopseudomonas]|uniref:MFS transporter n=1 Tax=Rhodopseudomonas palustris TaxID=1076 RepID=A0A0D7EL98_RHOPL|nr:MULTISPECIES: MDR family MFS transporter [Rhodopseudomonas]KIZ41588.1 MFS transporter [Rhodopseudomonas palustris]MDF3810360.1 MDR family MFS transporter [Rhodopseudomonas sp. BAL398]WOK19991.1 MDR family MFS transporter [Rhodopseudomonas sp. BAL398]
MSTSESHRREPASEPLLSDEAAAELTLIPTEVIDIGDAPPLAPAALSKSDVRAILMSLLLTMFLAALDQTIVATALPTIGRQFNDVTSLSWVITAYLLASTAVAPVFGTLSDIYGRRAMIILSLSLFVAGSIMCALAPSMTVLILGRALQGLGGGGIMPIVQTVISDVVTPRERGQYQAYFSAVWVSAGIGGPILGGLFAEHLHWSMIFWINVPLAIGALSLLLPKMKKIPLFHRRRKVDWAGGLLLMASALALMLVLTWGGNRFSWLSPTILALAGAAIVLGVSFVWHALHTAEPFLPLPLLGGSVVGYAMVAGGLAMGAMIGLTVHMPLYYEVVYHLSASESGLALIPIAAVSVGGAAFAGRAMTHMVHYKRIALLGTSFSALMACALAVLAPLPLWALLTLLSAFSIGLGTVFPVSVVSIQNAVARPQIGTATGAMNFFRALMASFTVAAFATILLLTLPGNVSLAGEHSHVVGAIPAADLVMAFRYVFGAAALMLATSAACLVVMEERPLAGPALPVELAE